MQAYEKAHHDYERHIDNGELQNNGTKEGKLQSERRKSKTASQPFYLYVIHMEKLNACFSKKKKILKECKKEGRSNPKCLHIRNQREVLPEDWGKRRRRRKTLDDKGVF